MNPDAPEVYMAPDPEANDVHAARPRELDAEQRQMYPGPAPRGPRLSDPRMAYGGDPRMPTQQIPYDHPFWDSTQSWCYPGSEDLQPQTRAYKIIGRRGKPTGKIVYAKNEIQAAALRQEMRLKDGRIYQPSAVLVDVIYEEDDEGFAVGNDGNIYV